jgi:ribosomal protein S25
MATTPAVSRSLTVHNECRNAVGVTQQRADTLHAWLTARPTDELPKYTAILKSLPCMTAPGALFQAFHRLMVQGGIEQRHGTRGIAKGHRVVLIVATGKILKTAGCPLTLDSPPNRRAHAVADATLRRVMEMVEYCATNSLYLPTPEHLGQRIGRSGGIARLALCELHDTGQLTLIQRGMRRAAELPDGRRTL